MTRLLFALRRTRRFLPNFSLSLVATPEKFHEEPLRTLKAWVHSLPLGTAVNFSKAEIERRANVEERVQSIIEKSVRPHAQSDGGDVIFRSMDHESGVVHVTMKGACVSCSSSTVTLKFMVLRLLQHYIDEVTDVEGHDDHCEDFKLCGGGAEDTSQLNGAK